MKNLSLYKVNKRINSTLLPTAEQLIGTMGVALKHATSIDIPTFVIAVGADDIDKIWSANYASYEGSYYWITDIVQINNTHVELQCKKDSLATYKDFILSTKAYVLYSDSHGRTDLLDKRNIKTINWTMRNQISTEVAMFNGNAGSYIIEVLNGKPSKYLSTSTFYWLSPSQMEAFMDGLYGTADFFADVVKSIHNPSNMLINAYYYPFDLAHFRGVFTGNEEDILVGDFNVGANGYRITNYTASQLAELVTVDLNDYISNDYRFNEENCSIKCYLPFLGMIDIDNSVLLREKIFFVRISLDIFTGTLMYEILIKNGDYLYKSKTYKTKFGITVPLGYQGINPLPIISSGLSVIGSVATAALAPEAAAPMLLAGAVSNTASNIMSAGSNLHKDNGTVGRLGSRVDYAWNKNISTIISTADLAETITAKKPVLGLPCCKTLDLSELSGFCQCQGVSVAAPAMESEIREINNFLNGGVYLE